MKLDIFFSKHPVFTLDELEEFLCKDRPLNKKTRNSLLGYHRRSGRLVSIRRGLYAVVPKGTPPDEVQVDPYLLAAKMTPDAVLGYHTALEFLGKAHSVFHRFLYLSARASVPVRYGGYEFQCVAVPKRLQLQGAAEYGVITGERFGVEIRTTGFERTLVDMLDRPDLSGAWEEIWRSLESIEFFDFDKVLEYVRLLRNATTAAKVGFFLEQHREVLMVEDKDLMLLHDLRPRQPHYLDRARGRRGRFVPKWNLVVPGEIIERTWVEVA